MTNQTPMSTMSIPLTMAPPLLHTPLYDTHVAAGAKMVDFAGFEMPVKYTGESGEHMTVRNAVGIFDVSHMGEVMIEGPGALPAVRQLLTNDIALIDDGQAMYAGLLNERGTFVDDVVAYRFSPEKVLIVVNAGNRSKDWQHIDTALKARSSVKATDVGDQWAQLAVQGPRAVDVIAALYGDDVRAVGGYRFVQKGAHIVARTGYTGEDGFELYVPAAEAVSTWNRVLEAGKPFAIAPCGLACRDTLRLEAGMALYGNDIDEDHTPLEANLGWIVKGTGFIGEMALQAQKAAGVPRLLRGLEMIDRGIARHGYGVHAADGAPIGVVTSGTQAPFVNRPIAMAYVNKPHAEPGTEVLVDVRGKKLKAKVVKLPFYKRQK